MKEYAYVSLRTGGVFDPPMEEHREVIAEYAAKGYRYVGHIPTMMSGHGVITRMDLIFERDK